MYTHIIYLFVQDYPKDAVAHVQKYLMKNEVPVNLFEVRNKNSDFFKSAVILLLFIASKLQTTNP